MNTLQIAIMSNVKYINLKRSDFLFSDCGLGGNHWTIFFRQDGDWRRERRVESGGGDVVQLLPAPGSRTRRTVRHQRRQHMQSLQECRSVRAVIHHGMVACAAAVPSPCSTSKSSCALTRLQGECVRIIHQGPHPLLASGRGRCVHSAMDDCVLEWIVPRGVDHYACFYVIRPRPLRAHSP